MAEGQIVLITGAGSGIGRETAYTFAEKGAAGLFLADLNDTAAAATAETSKKLATHPQFRVLSHRVNVTDRDDVDGMVDAAVAAFGRIDCAVNSAGIGTTMHVDITELPTAEFDSVHDVNARGMFFATSAEARAMLRQEERFVEGRTGRRSVGKGNIVNVTSLMAQMPIAMQLQYGSSKYAATGITMTAAVEMARKGVRVNCIMPSWVTTGMMDSVLERKGELLPLINELSPAGRMAYPEEIAESIYFLSSSGASYINGHAMVIDAGLNLTRGLA